jgi:hypothetical protein
MASSPSVAPWGDINSARRAFGTDAARGGRFWFIAPSSTPEQAMLIAQDRPDDDNPQAFLLEADHPLLEVVRSDRQPLGAFEDAMRLGGRWIFATAQGSGKISATIVWTIEDGVMRELARIPRSALGARPPVRLARRSDVDVVGLVVDGQVDAASRRSMLWVVPIALGSGVVDEPEELVPTRLGGSSVPACSLEDSGWVVEMPYPGIVRLALDRRWARLYSPLSRLRVSRNGACLEGLLGALESAPERPALGHVSEDQRELATHRTIDVGALSPVSLRSLRCWQSAL